MDDTQPISTDEMKLIALEEGLRSAILLDQLRLKMLNEAVEWISETAGMTIMEVRRELAYQKSGQVAKSLATINAVRSMLKGAEQAK
jgi:hypothetical protein